MLKNYLFATILMLLTVTMLNAQSCPLSIGNSSTVTKPHFKITSGTCNDYPANITIDGSSFSKGSCNGTNLYYDLDSGQSPLLSDDSFTVDFGLGDCVYVNGALQTLSTSELENSTNEILIYPNPITENKALNINFNKAINAHINIYDLTGKLVLSDEVLNASTQQINISDLNDGIYMIQIVRDNVSITRKIVIMK